MLLQGLDPASHQVNSSAGHLMLDSFKNSSILISQPTASNNNPQFVAGENGSVVGVP